MKISPNLLFLSILSLSFPLKAFPALKVEVSAKSAILMNAETGAVLWEKNAYTPTFPASTTKVITALYAAERKGGALDEMVEASHDAVSCVPPAVRRAAGRAHPPYRLEYRGTHMGIKAGEVLPLRTLFYGLMLCSGNDAANVIAEHVSGNVSTFMEEMNQFVRDKGCKDTVLHTPHGLPWEEHKTTAYDMAILAKEFVRHTFLREVVKSTQYARPQTNKQPESILGQFNALIKPGRFFYPKAFGIKTGYTDAAGYTLVSAAEDENRKLVAVIFGGETSEQRYIDAIALFEAGFNEKRVSRTLFSKGFDLFSHLVDGGKSPLQAYLSEDVILDYYPSEEPEFKSEVLWEELCLPIASGQRVANIQMIAGGGRIVASAPLYALRGVESTLSYQVGVVWEIVRIKVFSHVGCIMTSIGILLLGVAYYYTHRTTRRAPRRVK